MPLFLFISNALQVHGWELIRRKEKLMEYIQEMILERGEEDVLFNF